MTFSETKHPMSNRGEPPDSFLAELVQWGKGAPDEIFSANDNPADIYALVRPILGPWDGILHRRAVMLEVMRVHAGFESSWDWQEGVDHTNATSMQNIEGRETGIFQMSFNSIHLSGGSMKPFAEVHGIDTPATFIPAMKSNHSLCLEYYARLVRLNIRWAGPLVRGEILPFLRRGAVKEFETLLIG